MELTLPQLPYPYEALEPHISRRTLEFHHDKHHRAYVDKAQELAKKAAMTELPLETIIVKSAANAKQRDLFNNAAQVWNHSFYWQCLRPGGGGTPAGEIANLIASNFGSYDAFAEKFVQQGMEVFGTGWVWLVSDAGRLSITATLDADTPLVHGQTAVLTMDVWEHAYYLDYQNDRKGHLKAVIGHLLNWDFANQNLHRKHSAA